jgi:two-component system cell cycle sensor histidine kinase/response regulator CckA
VAHPGDPACFLDVNEYACQRLGYTREEILALGPLDLLDDEEISAVPDEAQRLLNERASTFVKNIIAKSGEKIPCEINASVFEHQGKSFVVSIGRDISERYQAEKDLKNSEQLYRSATEDTPVMICSFYPGGEIAFVNQAYCDYFGKNREELIGTNFLAHVPSQYHQTVMAEINALTPESPIDSVDHKAIAPDGSIRWQRWTNRAFFNQDGTVRIYQSFGEDITERKLSEEKLHESKQLFDLFMEHIPGAAFLKDSEGKLVYANENFARITGQNLEDLLGLSTDHLLPDDLRQQYAAENEQVLQGEMLISENEFPGPENTAYFINYKFPVKRGKKTPLLGSISLDITKRKLAEKATKQSEEKFRNLVEGSIQGVLIHDGHKPIFVNNTWASLHGYTTDEILAMDSVLPLISPADRERLIMYRDARLDGEYAPAIYEYQAIRKDGTILWLENQVKLVNWEGLACVQSTVVDISARKESELKLRESEERFKAIFDDANDGILVGDAVTKEFVMANNVICEMLGYTRDEILDLSVADIHPPKDLPAVIEAFEKQTNKEIRIVENLPVMRKDGSVFYADINSSPITIGSKTYLVGIFRDITERKMLQEAAERRIAALTSPIDDIEGITFDNLFDLNAIQYLQDVFAKATGVASIITHTDGTPLTEPSNFCRLCKEIIRQTETGRINCYKSDAVIGRHNPDGPVIQTCLSGGLWDAGAAITVGGKHIANWLIGQVRDAEQDDEQMRRYAHEIGADPEEMVAAFREVPAMSREQFKWVAQALFTLANQMSLFAYQNIQQARFIAEREVAQEALKARETFLNRVIDQSPFATWISDANGILQSANPALKQFLNLTDDQLVGKYNVLQDPLVEKQGLLPQIRSVYENGETIHFTCDWDGNDIPTLDLKGSNSVSIEATMFPIMNAAGEITNVVLNWIDITARKRAEEALRNREEQLSAIFKAAKTVSFIITNAEDPEPLVLEFSPGAENLFGYSREEMIGNPVSVLHLPDDVASFPEAHQKMREGKVGFSGETKLVRKSGEQFPALFTTYPIFDENQKMYAALGVSFDISERHKLEMQLRQAQKMDALGTLSSGIAHDFNNILAAIMGYSELVYDELDSNHSIRPDIEEIIKAASKAKKLVRQILTFTRQAEADQRPMSINHIIRESTAILQRTIPKMIQFEMDLAEEVKSIKADPQQIEQVLMNLVTNAVDAIEGSGKIVISSKNIVVESKVCDACGKHFSGDFVLISAKDSGCGMPPETKQRMFEPFYTTKGVGKGTGLGLSTVFGIAAGLGGHINCQSEIGNGTVFDIYLPAIDAVASSTKTAAESKEDALQGSETILVVDDESVIRDIATKILSRKGYRVWQASSAEDALELIKGKSINIDAIIMDLGMPGMGGKACLPHILKIKPDAKILIASGYMQYEMGGELEAIGAAGMVSKPYRKNDLLKSIRQLLDS